MPPLPPGGLVTRGGKRWLGLAIAFALLAIAFGFAATRLASILHREAKG